MPKLELQILQSYPVRVRFQGFESTTLQLAMSGWDLSVQEESFVHYGSHGVRLAMRHTGLRVYAISDMVTIGHREMYDSMFSEAGRSVLFGEMMKNLGFDMVTMGSNIAIQMINEASPLASRFNPMNPEPMLTTIQSLEEFRFFRTLSPDVKDIAVDPSKVPDLLDLVLKCQLPQQEAIRRRERSRENLDTYRRMGLENIKPLHEVRAQIITLAG